MRQFLTVNGGFEVFYITGLGWYHLLVFTLLVPWMAWRSKTRVAAAIAGLAHAALLGDDEEDAADAQ